MRFVLPIPPSLNNAYANRKDGKGRFATKALEDWKIEAGWIVKASAKSRIDGPFRVALYLPLKMRGDIGNREKAATDLLVSLHVIPDDSLAQSILIERNPFVKPGECVVEVSPA